MPSSRFSAIEDQGHVTPSSFGSCVRPARGEGDKAIGSSGGGRGSPDRTCARYSSAARTAVAAVPRRTSSAFSPGMRWPEPPRGAFRRYEGSPARTPDFDRDVDWADVICVMEQEQEGHIRNRWPAQADKIRVLGIPDIYQPHDATLEALLTDVVRTLLADGPQGRERPSTPPRRGDTGSGRPDPAGGTECWQAGASACCRPRGRRDDRRIPDQIVGNRSIRVDHAQLE